MPIDRDALLAWEIPEVQHTYTERDTILYALGLGLGMDPMSEDLRFTYERGLRALPTMAVILGYPGFWMSDPRTGVNWKALLHGEQSFRNFKPLPASGTVVGRTRVKEVLDKGPGKGALVFSEREVIDAATGDRLSLLQSTSVLRADGGFGGPSGPVPTPASIPDRVPDHVVDCPTLRQAALIYRLSGDYNPLHADPKIAETAGFQRPILHGLCTFGMAGYALLKTLCDFEPARLHAMQCRFSASVLPGETLRTEIWHDGDAVAFRVSVPARQVIVLNNGRAELS